MNFSVCFSPTVQWANTISLVRALIMEGLAMNADLPVRVFTTSMVKTDCRSPSHPAMMPSSFSSERARQPVAPVISISLKQLNVSAESFSSSTMRLTAWYIFMAFSMSSAEASRQASACPASWAAASPTSSSVSALKYSTTRSSGMSTYSMPQRRLASR